MPIYSHVLIHGTYPVEAIVMAKIVSRKLMSPCFIGLLRSKIVRPETTIHLLDIARLHSGQRAALAISMVRPKDLERRITAILDASKSRLRVTRRRAIALLSVIAVAGLLVGLAGPMGSDATAQAPQKKTDANTADSKAAEQAEPKQSQEKKANPGDAPLKPEMRPMRVRVVDAEGKPLAGVKILNNASIRPKASAPEPFIQTIDYRTDQHGVADMSLPVKADSLRLWAIKPHYVPLFTSWEPNALALGNKIPDEYVFTLERGAKIGGKVVDSSGKPIAGVSVHVQAESSNRQELKAGQAVVYRGLSEEDSIETDEHGNWSIDNAPPAGKDEYTFSTRLVHPDYISDDNWGETQQRSDVTQEQLRDLNAVFRMAKGAPIKGRITLPDGKPAITGVVIWHRRPYFTPGSQECHIEADGTFTTAALPEGEHPLTVVVPGYSPWFQQVRVYPDMGPLDVQLEPGNAITIRVQDAHGRPVPRAYVGVAGWKDMTALYNSEHSDILTSGIPRRADEEGVFRWMWAPTDGVKYHISSPGYSYREVVLSASPQEHVIILEAAMQIAGKVIDKTTGQPIAQFDVIPVNVFRPDWLYAFCENARIGRDGQYLLDDVVSQPDRPYRVRIEADGYRSAMSPLDISVHGRHEVDFELEPAPPLRGKVVLPDGKPAVAAEVHIATPTTVPDENNNRVDSSKFVLTTTDDKGQFTWRAPFEPLLMHVVHDQGFAKVELAVDQPIGTIRLQPWASVKGRLTQAGKPIAKERIDFWPQADRKSGQPRFEDRHYVESDAEGRFEFERLPPIAGCLRVYLGPWEDSPLQSSQSVPLELKPGDKVNVELGGSGTHITGQVVPTGRGGAELDENYSLNYLVARRPGIPVPPELLPPEFDIQHPFDERALSTLSGNPWLHSKDNYFVKLSPEGDLNVHGVPAGEYDLVIQLFEKPAGCLVESIGQRVIPVIVSQSDVASGTLKLGRIEVPCRVGPRIGSDMDLYAFTDATGRGTTIAQERGKHVVLQFWATWCGPCIESMKNIEPRIDRINHDKLVIAAINIDSDPREAKRFAIANRFTWANDFVGAKSKIAQQLAISTLPAYFLIDGEGKLAATAVKWEDIEKELKRRELVD